MTRLVWGLEDYIGRWLSSGPFPEMGPNYRPHRAVAWVSANNVLIAALALDYAHPWDGQLTIYAEKSNFWTRRQIETLFRVAFNTWGLTRLTLWVDKQNKPVRRFVERLGFRLEGVKKQDDGKSGECLYGMVKSDCRWLKEAPNAEARAA